MTTRTRVGGNAAKLVALACTLIACRRGSSTGSDAAARAATSSTSTSTAPSELRVGDIVDLPLGTALAASPGGTASVETVGSPALVLSVSPTGHRRVLAADGSSGWTPSPLRKVVSARVHSSVDLDLARFVRGDPRRYDDAQHPWLTLGANGVATIIGASRELEAESDVVPSADETGFHDQPLLHLETKGGTGYVHGLSLDVEWNPVLEVDVRHPATAAGRGILRRPFLAPLKASAWSSAATPARATRRPASRGASKAVASSSRGATEAPSSTTNPSS